MSAPSVMIICGHPWSCRSSVDADVIGRITWTCNTCVYPSIEFLSPVSCYQQTHNVSLQCRISFVSSAYLGLQVTSIKWRTYLYTPWPIKRCDLFNFCPYFRKIL